jgi:hypothetical protein
VGGPVKEVRLDCAVGEVGVEMVAEGEAVLFRLDCLAPGAAVVVRVVVEDKVIGEIVVVVVEEVVGEKDFEGLTFVIPRAEAKAWVSREGPDCLGMGPGPRAFLLLEAEPIGIVSVWCIVSLALASPWGKSWGSDGESKSGTESGTLLGTLSAEGGGRKGETEEGVGVVEVVMLSAMGSATARAAAGG